jgi:(p)ppGpp synthase/HD superfamily hydrolase
MPAPPPTASPRLLAALELAGKAHGPSRKRTGVPYLGHVLAVTGLVLEDGGTEDEAIAALLHDSVEEGGGRPLLEQIRARFGQRVAEIVEGCSDEIDGSPEGSWRERKERYLAHLPEVEDGGVLRVSLADKVQNARSFARTLRRPDYREDEVTPTDRAWYYERLADFFVERRPGPLADDLRAAADAVRALIVTE